LLASVLPSAELFCPAVIDLSVEVTIPILRSILFCVTDRVAGPLGTDFLMDKNNYNVE